MFNPKHMNKTFNRYDEMIDSSNMDSLIDKKGNFHFNGQSMLLTYPGLIDKSEIKHFFRTFSSDKNGNHRIPVCLVAHETGHGIMKTNRFNQTYEPLQYNDHTHVFLKWSQRMQMRSKRRFNYKGIAPHILRLKGRFEIKYGVYFVSREDKSLSSTKLVDNTKFEEYQYKFEQVHYDIYNFIDKYKESRKCSRYWIYDNLGTLGSFTDWLSKVDNSLTIGDFNKISSALHKIEVSKLKNADSIVLRFSEKMEHDINTYQIINMICEGEYEDYVGRSTVNFEPPCIIVVTEFYPDNNKIFSSNITEMLDNPWNLLFVEQNEENENVLSPLFTYRV